MEDHIIERRIHVDRECSYRIVSLIARLHVRLIIVCFIKKVSTLCLNGLFVRAKWIHRRYSITRGSQNRRVRISTRTCMRLSHVSRLFLLLSISLCLYVSLFLFLFVYLSSSSHFSYPIPISFRKFLVSSGTTYVIMRRIFFNYIYIQYIYIYIFLNVIKILLYQIKSRNLCIHLT